jgi:hypothetical protein
VRPTINGKIKFHRDLEKSNLDMAKKAARRKDYYEAQRWYGGAAFHKQVADVLKLTAKHS